MLEQSLEQLVGQINRATAAFHAGDFDACLAVFCPLLAIVGPQPDWTQFASMSHLARGDHQEALTLLAAGLAANGRAAGLWLTAATAWEAAGNPSLARACVERAATLRPHDPAIVPLRSRLQDNPPEARQVPETWQALWDRPAVKPTIGACMIVRNESKLLPDCLESIKGLDQLVVVDTGSTDDTVAIAERFGVQIGHFTWCDDFAAARNAALTRMTTDWILIIDADERIGGGGIPAMRQGIDDHGFPQAIFAPLSQMVGDVPGAGSQDRASRLFANVPGHHFVNAIHEGVADASGKPLLPWLVDDWHIVHLGYTSVRLAETKKGERNTRLLEARLAAAPEDAEACFYLGLEYRHAGRFAEARTQLERYLALQPDGPRTAVTILQLLRVLDGLGDNAGMIRTGEAHRQLCSHLPDFWLLLGLAYARQDDRQRAKACFQQARVGTDRRGEYETEGARTWQPAVFLAQLANLAGDWAKVQAELQPVLGEAGHQAIVHQLYLQALMSLGRFEAAADHCERWLSGPEGHEGLADLFASVLERFGRDGQEILACFEEWPGSFGLLTRRMMAAQEWERLLAYCEQWVPTVGAVAEAHAGIAHLVLGQPLEAKAAFERSLSLDPRHFLALHNLGQMAMAEGNVVGADDLLQQAHAVQPQALPTLIRLVETARQQGDGERAHRYLAAATALNPDHPEIARLRSILA